VVDHGISGQYVTRILDAIARFRPLPQTLRTDHGPGPRPGGRTSVASNCA
jgi:hypothetical protein